MTSEKHETQGSVAIGPGASAPRISIVIPAMNEARNLPHVLPQLPTDCEIILVDGHSTDETVLVAQRLRPDIVVICQTRIGKGNALACGFAAATGEYIVMIDADLTYDFDEIPRNEADFLGQTTALFPGTRSRKPDVNSLAGISITVPVAGSLNSHRSFLS